MSNEGVLVPIKIQISIPNSATPLEIVPLGDIHRHSPACAIDVWKRDLKKLKEDHNENTYYLGLGDFDDFMSESERKISRDLHDSTLDQHAQYCDRCVDELAEELAFTNGHWLGMLEGNHHWNYGNGITTTHKLAHALGAKWLGTIAYIIISVTNKSLGARMAIDIVATHGKAGGKLIGTSINQVDDMKRIFPEADIYIHGHNHDRGAWPTTCLKVTSSGGGKQPSIVHKEQILCRSGSYLRGYVPGKSSYVAGRLLRPTSLGYVRFKIRLLRVDRLIGRCVTPEIKFTV